MSCCYVLDLQSWKKYIRQTLVFTSNSAVWENFNLISIFQQFSASIKHIEFKGNTGH